MKLSRNLLRRVVATVILGLAWGGQAAAAGWQADLDRAIAEALTPEQLEQFVDGADPASLVVADGVTLRRRPMDVSRHLVRGVVAVAVILGLAWGVWAADSEDRDAELSRIIAEALTPDQLKLFVAGADPASLAVAEGVTLADLLNGLGKAQVAGGLVYYPVKPCRVVNTPSTAGGEMGANETRQFDVRGAGSLAAQGGSATGCGVAADAESVIANFKVWNMDAKGALSTRSTCRARAGARSAAWRSTTISSQASR